MATMTTEDYVITLNMLHDEGVRAIPARLAELLDVSAPTVTQALHRLERDGFLQWSNRREIELTDRGQVLAKTLIRRHRLIERWLTDVLGLDWASADEEAHHLMHAISPRVEERLLHIMGYPTTCPHGNPISGPGDERPASIRLNEVAPGATSKLFRISELAEVDRRLMLFFFEQGICPGAEIEVASATEAEIRIRLNGRMVSLTRTQAGFLWMHVPELLGTTPPPSEKPLVHLGAN